MKEYQENEFSMHTLVYYIRPNGEQGCSTTADKFKEYKDKYKDCILIFVNENVPIYFRKN